jgi:hypothetical protein
MGFKNTIVAFSCKGFAIKLADSSGWFKESETTPVIVFWEKAEREMRRKSRKDLDIDVIELNLGLLLE